MSVSSTPTAAASPGSPEAGVLELTLQLTRLGLNAPDLGSAMIPVLDALVAQTSAEGAGYFQLADQTLAYHARAASGVMPEGPAMDALLAHGLPRELPLISALEASPNILYFQDTDGEPAANGFPELGVCALIAAPIHDRAGRLVGALLAHVFQPHDWSPPERHLIDSVTGLLTLLAARLDAEEREHAAHEGALRAMGLSLEARDAETQGHTDRVTALALRLGQRFALEEGDLRALRWGAYLHDIGKVAVPDSILLHDGPLTPEMRARMELHVADGVALAQQLPFLPPATLDVIAGHHERWDGAGYPQRLVGEQIPLLARIFAVCDVYDALTNVRPYKRAWTVSETLAHVQASSGTHFDPQVVDALLNVLADATGLSESA
ncbi:HD domain-containing protein [Deinococcus sp. D7000]|nr:HD domain-containing protein [Deinococcus sp. D7000]